MNKTETVVFDKCYHIVDNHLARLCWLRNIRYVDVSAKCGISQITLSKIANNRQKDVGVNTAYTICQNIPGQPKIEEVFVFAPGPAPLTSPQKAIVWTKRFVAFLVLAWIVAFCIFRFQGFSIETCGTQIDVNKLQSNGYTETVVCINPKIYK